MGTLQDREETPFGPGLKHYGVINPILNRFPREEAEGLIPDYLAAVPAAMRYLAEELGEKPFFGGSSPHYADFWAWHYVDNVGTLDGGVTLDRLGEPGQNLRTWYDALAALPAVAAYLQERPKPGTGQAGLPGSILATVAVPSQLPIVRLALGLDSLSSRLAQGTLSTAFNMTQGCLRQFLYRSASSGNRIPVRLRSLTEFPRRS